MSFPDIEDRALRVRRFEDDVSTDYIIASSRKKETIDTEILKQYVFEDIRPGFFSTLRPGDVVAAGNNFGCGSAMEIAVTVLMAAGIRVVVARSFARTFLRNAYNNGLVALTADTATLVEGACIRVVGLSTGRARIEGAEPQSGELECAAIPAFMLDILSEGGLVPYLRSRKGFAG